MLPVQTVSSTTVKTITLIYCGSCWLLSDLLARPMIHVAEHDEKGKDDRKDLLMRWRCSEKKGQLLLPWTSAPIAANLSCCLRKRFMPRDLPDRPRPPPRTYSLEVEVTDGVGEGCFCLRKSPGAEGVGEPRCKISFMLVGR